MSVYIPRRRRRTWRITGKEKTAYSYLHISTDTLNNAGPNGGVLSRWRPLGLGYVVSVPAL